MRQERTLCGLHPDQALRGVWGGKQVDAPASCFVLLAVSLHAARDLFAKSSTDKHALRRSHHVVEPVMILPDLLGRLDPARVGCRALGSRVVAGWRSRREGRVGNALSRGPRRDWHRCLDTGSVAEAQGRLTMEWRPNQRSILVSGVAGLAGCLCTLLVLRIAPVGYVTSTRRTGIGLGAPFGSPFSKERSGHIRPDASIVMLAGITTITSAGQPRYGAQVAADFASDRCLAAPWTETPPAKDSRDTRGKSLRPCSRLSLPGPESSCPSRTRLRHTMAHPGSSPHSGVQSRSQRCL
jgi:hypothetical protein